METSLKAAEVLVPPQPDKPSSSLDAESSEAVAAAASTSSDTFDPMEEFSRRLEDIVRTHGSAAGLLDKQGLMEAEMDKMKEAKGDMKAAVEKEISVIMQGLNKLSSPQEKLDDVVRKYAELAASRRCDEQKLSALQQRLSVLQDERCSAAAARSKLEALCRELQAYYNVLREETLQRCREDEEKRTEITSHFQNMLTEIQTQIEQHSTRNDKLCRENTHLTDKLESLMGQCERREESLEKINKHRDLQYKLTEAKLQQANALLDEAVEKHKREKEYLLVQAAEWKLQAQTLREQETVMQAQLALYAQKFDEFQATLAKSNEIYVRFKQEMDNMSEKMKKMEKESNLWKTRFENCNKALTDMIEERTEKGKEYALFVLKIHKLEKLCHALQDERKVLYDKIRDVRCSNANISSKCFSSSDLSDNPDAKGADKSALLSPQDLQELQQLQEEDPVLTEDMARLKEEQAKLQEFAASLLATPVDKDEEENDELALEEDMVASAFVHFNTKPQVIEYEVEDVKSEEAESDLPQPVNTEEVQNPPVPTPEALRPEEKTSETVSTDPKPDAVKVQTQVEAEEVKQVKPDEEIQQQQQPVAPTPEPEEAKTDPPTEAGKAEILEETGEVKPVEDEKAEQQQQQQQQQQLAEPVQGSDQTPKTSTPSSKNKPKPAAASNADSSKKQAPKKKKKRSGKSAS